MLTYSNYSFSKDKIDILTYFKFIGISFTITILIIKELNK